MIVETRPIPVVWTASHRRCNRLLVRQVDIVSYFLATECAVDDDFGGEVVDVSKGHIAQLDEVHMLNKTSERASCPRPPGRG